jgi:polar amino acid transport system substrate-binding protein
MRRRPLPLALAAATALAIAACAPQEESTDAASTSGGGSAATGACTPDELDTLEPGTLTVATDQPAYEPWFVDDAPENGEGFESAVAYAVAEQLSYTEDQVTWTRVPFTAAIQPGPRPFDIDINQFSITEERRQAVDFSSPYYTVSQAVITTAGSPADGAASLEELRGLRLGAQVATTSLQVLTEVIAPENDPVVFNTNDDAKLALSNGQVDAIVVDLPTAFFITAAELQGGKIVGQLPATGTPEQFGAVLDKGSPLTGCVSQAIEKLRAAGTLTALEQQWLTAAGSAPELK